jgi:hypothetical protein
MVNPPPSNEILDVNEVILESYIVIPPVQGESLRCACDELCGKIINVKIRLASPRIRVENVVSTHGKILGEIFT